MMKKIPPRGRHFWKMFLPYFLILLVTSLFSCALIFNSLRTGGEQLERVERESDTRVLTQQLDARFQTMYAACQRMSSLRWVWRVVADQLPDALEVKKIVSEFPYYSDGSTAYDSVCIAFPEQQIIVNRWGLFSYEDFYRFAEDIPQSIRDSIDAPSSLGTVQAEPVRIQGASYLWILQTMNTGMKPRIQIVFLVNIARLRQSIERTLPGGVAAIDILDANGNVVVSAASGAAVQESAEVSALISGWRYRLYYPKAPRVLSSGELIVFLLPFLAALLFGPFISYGLTSFSYQPVRKLLKKLPGGASDDYRGEEYAVIERYMEDMSRDNCAMKQKLSEYRSYTVNGLLQQLLAGYFETDDPRRHFSECGLDYAASTAFAVLLIPVDAMDSGAALRRNLAVMLFVEQLLKKTPLDSRLLLMPQDGIAVILSDNQGRLNEALLQDVVSYIETECERADGDLPTVCSGTVETGFVGVSLSYQHAKETARQRLFAESSVRENAFGPTYYYPTDWQIQLINNLKMAKLEPAQKIVGELKIENERMQVSADGMAALLYALRDTVCRVAGEMGMGDWKERTEAQLGGELEDEAPFSWEWIDAACRVLCARSTYQAGTTDLGLHMVQYVDAHYMESAMSLKEVAARFDTSVTTVSHLFKSAAGLNFSNYLLRLRMEQAKRLMEKEKIGLQKLSEAVGYDNKESFKRAFTRYEGISPYEYRCKLNGEKVSELEE